ncbi:unnamed protein product [Bursaphelenchus okinawaensis]|uniref:Methionine--tRNA ligase, cytoplasmic n=1 Tax=Bursaphelenchus okinawaensis TaxID=465554 RepID=A0A811LQQ7_9BILA|nr:unnamed protein product [Bursaphelenchus okinawaensis]CAG9125982.1 unnamed protein product [Bursaphelenchus okinawaensis]
MGQTDTWGEHPGVFSDDEKKKLPVDGKRNILITSALPYVNNVPHLGNIIGCVLSGDVFSRYCRLRAYQVLHISGTDEYGTATEMKALQEKTTPAEICEKFHKLHKQIYEWFNIDFDNFGRTTTENQTEICQKFFLQLHENGFTSTSSLEQLHCSSCNKFLADRYVFGTCPHCNYNDARGDQCDKCAKLLDAVNLIDPKCHICGSTPQKKTSEHIFLNLDALSSEVENFLDEKTKDSECKWSTNAISICRSWIKQGLEKRCITRDIKWGTPVPLPGFDGKVFYVWFDAPIGYLSITKTLLGSDWEKWWKNKNVELYQFVGKDNVAFHGIMFPATQIGTKDSYTMVKNLCATEYLNYEDQKFSKSRGTGVFGDQASGTGIPADVWRFYLIYMRPENQDTAFIWDDFALKVNSELLANLGNFVLRALSFLSNNFNGLVPKITLNDEDKELINDVNVLLTQFIEQMENVKMRDALQTVLAISRKGNQYMQTQQPWVLVKKDETKERGASVIGLAANLSCLLSVVLFPFMPATSQALREQCGISEKLLLPTSFCQFLKEGHKIGKPVALFTKLEPAKMASLKAEFGGIQENGVPAQAQTQKKEVKKPKKEKTTVSQAKSAFPQLLKNQNDIFKLLSESRKKFEQYKGQFAKSQLESLRNQFAELNKDFGKVSADLLKFEKEAGVPIVTVELPQETPSSSQTEQPKEVVEKENKKPKAKENPLKEKKGGNAKAAPVADGVDIGRLDLRVGLIREAKKHPDAEALYVETIDLGEDKPRTVISGLVKHVPLDQMQNRLVVCLCNLKPVKMRGIESQAMVMCASSPEKVEIMEVPEGAQPGDFVTCEPFKHRPDGVLNPKKKIWEGVSVDLKVSLDGKAIYKDKELTVAGKGPMTAPTLRDVFVK